MSQDIVNIIIEASRMGAAEAIKAMKPADDRISQRQAVAEFGAAFIRDNSALLTVTRNGNRKEYSRAELQQVKASKNVRRLATRIEINLTKTF